MNLTLLGVFMFDIIRACGPEHRYSFLGYVAYRKIWESSSMCEMVLYLTKKFHSVKPGDFLKDFPSSQHVLIMSVTYLNNEDVKILGYKINA